MVKRREEKKRQGRRKIKKRVETKFLVVLLIFLLIINYPFLDNLLKDFLDESQTVFAERVIDGDTIDIGNESVRLLGINTPERGEQGYEEAKDFLVQQVLGKNVTLEFVGERYDKYGRILAYVFLNNTNINMKMVENGFANYYFYSGKDKYSDDLLDAWNKCLDNRINICEPSTNICGQCIEIEDNKIKNSCNFSCNIIDWQVKGEGREKFIFSEQTLFPGADSRFALDLTNSGGGLFLRDEQGKLVDWKSG